MLNLVRTFVRNESGEDLIEYGLLSSFISAVALVTVISDPLGIQSSLLAAFRKAVRALYMAAQGDLNLLR
jgi:Flp pilus assembly pilin Flp